MKLKDRLSIALTLVAGAALGISFFVVVLLVRREEIEDLDRAILSQATAAVHLILQQDWQNPRVVEGAGEIPELPVTVRRYEAIYNHEGALLSATRTFGRDAPPFQSLGIHESIPSSGTVVDLIIQGNRLRGVVLPFGEANRYRLLYALTRRSVDEDTHFLSEVFIALFVAALAVTALFSRWLGARLVGDVETLASVARAVASGDLAARVQGRTTDSSELRALGEDVDRMIGQLSELVFSQRTFVSHAAHELRSPLATIHGQLQLALRRPRTDTEYREIIEESLSDVESLIALAEDLLVLARLQGTPRQGEGIARVEELVRDAIRMARGPAEAKGITFQEHLESISSLPVKGSRADLARAVRNLLDNAVTHSPANTVVTLEGRLKEDQVELAVCDQGSGVSLQDIPKLFSPFFRGSKEQSGEIYGTGLGLTIVREIARASGGDIFLDETNAKGARFVLVLPIKRA